MKHGGNVWEGDPGKWLDFSANLRPEGPPEWVRDTLTRSLEDVRYYPDRSMRTARTGLARYLGLPEAQVLPTAGGTAAIDLILSSGTGRVLIPQTTFSEYAARASVYGREVVLSQEEPQQGDLLILCNPNNPNGALHIAESVLSLHRRAKAAGAALLVDEAFIDFAPEETVRHHVCPGLTVVGSMTKILCIPGIRLGYIAGDSETISRLAERMIPWPLSAPATAVAAALPEHLKEIRADRLVNERRRFDFARQLQALGALPFPSAANFLLVRFPRDMQDIVARLKKQGILVRTCTSFGLDGHDLRLAVRLDNENARLVSILKEELQR